MTDLVEHEATPSAELERQIMDPNIPKNEREWWAAAEIERLRELLREALVYGNFIEQIESWWRKVRAALEPKP